MRIPESPASSRSQQKQRQKNGRQDKRGRHRRWHNVLCGKALRRHAAWRMGAALAGKCPSRKGFSRAVYDRTRRSTRERRDG
jgi:hypothetical protein